MLATPVSDDVVVVDQGDRIGERRGGHGLDANPT